VGELGEEFLSLVSGRGEGRGNRRGGIGRIQGVWRVLGGEQRMLRRLHSRVEVRVPRSRSDRGREMR